MEAQLIIFIAASILLFFILLKLIPVNLWITATFSGVQISLMELFFMRIRKTPVKEVVNGLIISHKAGFPLDLATLETHSLAGGNVLETTVSYVKLRNNGIEINFSDVAGADLAGINLESFVEKKQKSSGEIFLRKELCKRIMNELSDDKLEEVKLYLNQFT
ncbi:flotillin-like FloA family protein [Ekhidna sp.]